MKSHPSAIPPHRGFSRRVTGDFSRIAPRPGRTPADAEPPGKMFLQSLPPQYVPEGTHACGFQKIMTPNVARLSSLDGLASAAPTVRVNIAWAAQAQEWRMRKRQRAESPFHGECRHFFESGFQPSANEAHGSWACGPGYVEPALWASSPQTRTVEKPLKRVPFITSPILRRFALWMAVFLSFAQMANAQTSISNVQFQQRSDDWQYVDITYDLQSSTSQTLAVMLEISEDGGATWSVPSATATGDIGASVRVGSNKKITWRAGYLDQSTGVSYGDFPNKFSDKMQFKISAAKGNGLRLNTNQGGFWDSSYGFRHVGAYASINSVESTRNTTKSSDLFAPFSAYQSASVSTGGFRTNVNASMDSMIDFNPGLGFTLNHRSSANHSVNGKGDAGVAWERFARECFTFEITEPTAYSYTAKSNAGSFYILHKSQWFATTPTGSVSRSGIMQPGSYTIEMMSGYYSGRFGARFDGPTSYAYSLDVSLKVGATSSADLPPESSATDMSPLGTVDTRNATIVALDPTGWGGNGQNLLLPASGEGARIRITQDLDRLATGGHVLGTVDGPDSPPFGVVSDGVSRLVLRYQSRQPGMATVSFATAADGKAGTTGDAMLDGRLSLDGTTPTYGPLTLTTREKDGKHYLFPVYHAPSDFPATHYRESSRDIYLKIVFQTAGGGAEKTDFVRVLIQRPPLVLLHGIWSNAQEAFGGFIQHMHSPAFIQSLEISAPDYPNSLAFDHNRYVLDSSIEALRASHRLKGIVMTQADVIGHSMGGLLARRRQGLNYYERLDNYGEGDINRLITIDSPHLGSALGNLAWKRAHEGRGLFPASFIRLLSRRLRIPFDSGSVRDLQVGSEAIRELHALSNKAPSHAIIGDFTGPNPCDEGLYQANRVWCSLLDVLGIPPPHDLPGHENFPTHSDRIVSVDSQRGGLPPGSNTVFSHVHSGAANRPEVVARCLGLLNTEPTDPAFHQGFPSISIPEVLPQRVPRGGPGIDTDGDTDAAGLAITAPAEGASASPGETVGISVSRTSGEELVEVVIFTPNQTKVLSSSPFIGTIALETEAVGSIPVVVAGKHADGEWSMDEITLNVQPVSPLTVLQVEAKALLLNYRGTPRRYTVTGTYADGITRDLSGGMTGTTYAVAHPAVATVDADGWVSAVGNGETTLTITHGGQQLTRSVRVLLEPEPELTVTASTGGGATGWLAGEEPRVTFTVANTGADAATNAVVYFTLPEGLSIDETEPGTGTWRVTDDEVAWVVGALAPGAQATVTLNLSGAAGSAGEMSVFATSDAPTPLAGANALPLGLRVFRDPAFRLHPGATAGALTLAWNSETGVTYVLEASADLAGPWTEISQHPGTGTEHTLSVPQRTEEPKRHFYRLKLRAGM